MPNKKGYHVRAEQLKCNFMLLTTVDRSEDDAICDLDLKNIKFETKKINIEFLQKY